MAYKKSVQTRSIIEESSSVVKAIEKAWTQIGKPAEFSVKILEHEQKNFLGLSTKPAKVSIFFHEAAADQRESRDHGKHDRPARHERHEREHVETDKAERTERPGRFKSSSGKREQHHEKDESPREQQSSVQRWSDTMINDVRQWLETSLKILGKDSSFTTQANNYCLKITFARPLFADNEKERAFYRLSSYLIMQSLRTSSKEGFRGFKIIMSSASH